MNELTYKYYTDFFGREVRDIEVMYEDGIIVDVDTEIKTPCGWKSDLGSPSCTKMCNDNCPMAIKCMREWGEDIDLFLHLL